MNTVSSRRPSLPFIPGYSNNAVLQLILASGVGFVLYHFLIVVLMLLDQNIAVITYTGLPPIALFKDNWWTLITYGWVHNGFWELLSNMLWVYCFGSVVQSLVGHKQVIPLFIYSLLAGGAFYLLAQLIPGVKVGSNTFLLGAQAGIVGLAVASIAIAPRYRFFLGPNFSIPIVVVVGIFIALMLLNAGTQPALLLLLAGGGLTGFVYVRVLRAGYRPGEWVYDAFGSMERVVTPNERNNWKKNSKKRAQVLNKMNDSHQGIHEKRIDEILDKINQHGYNSLSTEEKDILVRASKEK